MTGHAGGLPRLRVRMRSPGHHPGHPTAVEGCRPASRGWTLALLTRGNDSPPGRVDDRMTVMTFHQLDYTAAPDRYENGIGLRRCGRSGLDLPLISLGLWHNFGDDVPLSRQQATLRRAFDRGVTHFDLANNYGPPYGSAERNFGAIFARDFRPYRDELIISSKAGYDM